MNRVDRAVWIAANAHCGQTDKAGRPYIMHPISVAANAKDEDHFIVAMLHDVIKDSPYTEADICDQFGHKVALAVESLTHREGESYAEYILRISRNNIATRVKLWDLHHNSDLSRIPNPTDRDRKRVEKYAHCMDFLYGLMTESKFLEFFKN